MVPRVFLSCRLIINNNQSSAIFQVWKCVIYYLFCAKNFMKDRPKKAEKLQSREDTRLSEGEREKDASRPGTGAREKIKPASSREVSPNTPSGEDI